MPSFPWSTVLGGMPLVRVCHKAGLPESGWRRLRRSFGADDATFGVNPWRLVTLMGHKRVDETMLYGMPWFRCSRIPRCKRSR